MRLRKVLPVFAVLLLVFGCTQVLNAQRDRDRGRGERRWVHLGEKHVDGRADHDTIDVRGRFRQLQIRVSQGAVDFQRVVVHFGNGADEDLNFRERINAGGSTRALDLRGYERDIRSVEFWYEKANWGRRRPTVELFGR